MVQMTASAVASSVPPLASHAQSNTPLLCCVCCIAPGMLCAECRADNAAATAAAAATVQMIEAIKQQHAPQSQ